MKIWITLVAALVITGLQSQTALADAQAGEAYFTVMGTYIDDDEKSQLDDGVSGGQFGFGKAFQGPLNIEGYVMAAELDGFPGQSQMGLGVDLQLVINRAGRFTPYLFAGPGYLTLNPDGAPDSDGLMLSGGAGFLADIFGDSNIALRGEYRLRTHDIAGVDTDDNLFSLGFQFPFGARAVTAVPPVVEADSDGDGVPDSIDRCPGTPRGVSVDAEGCPLDSDGDGVPDHQDECPDTVRGAAVDEKGCELDSDNDGVVDRLDRCPDTAPGVQVDVRGCEIKEEIRLQGVNFETNSDQLLPGAESVLDEAAATLAKNPSIRVEVAGHTDSDGTAEYNEGLSARRAATVRDYLIASGVAEGRMTTRGYGESQPIADNSTAIGKAENRRVVLRIVER
ncbi:MAG TPA: OmpA family protein [Woeseiaceae bacterium]